MKLKHAALRVEQTKRRAVIIIRVIIVIISSLAAWTLDATAAAPERFIILIDPQTAPAGVGHRSITTPSNDYSRSPVPVGMFSFLAAGRTLASDRSGHSKTPVPLYIYVPVALLLSPAAYCAHPTAKRPQCIIYSAFVSVASLLRLAKGPIRYRSRSRLFQFCNSFIVQAAPNLGHPLNKLRFSLSLDSSRIIFRTVILVACMGN